MMLRQLNSERIVCGYYGAVCRQKECKKLTLIWQNHMAKMKAHCAKYSVGVQPASDPKAVNQMGLIEIATGKRQTTKKLTGIKHSHSLQLMTIFTAASGLICLIVQTEAIRVLHHKLHHLSVRFASEKVFKILL